MNPNAKREQVDALYGAVSKLVQDAGEQWHCMPLDESRMLGCGDTEELALDDAIANFPDGVPAP